MCGIFGMISRKTKPFNKRAFCTMGVRNDSRGGDSCGIFIDGLVEYGIDKQKLFINFFRDSILLNTVTDCKVALGHCRKASVGKVNVETAQPVVIYNEKGEVDFVLIHNGTIYNYKELAEKYIPDINIDGLTDSQVMARIFYYKGYDVLDEYIGGAVFVIHDYRINKSLVFKGASKKYSYSVNTEEERPLYYCWHNGRFVFSSIFETLYSFYYEEVVYTLTPNKLMVVRGDKLKLVKEYTREQATQSKPITVVKSSTSTGSVRYIDDDDEYFSELYREYYKNSDNHNFKIGFDGTNYLDDKKQRMHGVYFLTSYGYVYPNKKDEGTWLQKVAFFQGQMLKHPNAFALINQEYLAANKNITPKVRLLINMMNFNPFTDDLVQYYWYEDESLMVPTGTWKFPMADYSISFDEDGTIIDVGKDPYWGWVNDYKMYTYEEAKIKEAFKTLCEGE